MLKRDIDIITIKNFDYRCIIHNISKYEAINLLKNAVLDKFCLQIYIKNVLNFSQFVPDHLRIISMCKHSVKKLPYLLRYVSGQCRTHQIVIKLFQKVVEH